MSDGLYVGMNGAAARMLELDAIADNLANAHTPGFKAERPAFASVLAASRDGTSGAVDQVHAVATGTALDLRPGAINRTGRPLDLVPEANSFFAVERPDGSRAYTRKGGIQLDPTGALVIDGMPLLGVSGNAVRLLPGQIPQILPDGSVKTDDVIIDRLALFDLSGPIDRLGKSLLAPGAGGTANVSTAGRVRPGELEMSNVNPLEATVALVGAQRSFENATNALSTYRRMDDKLAEIGRIR